MKILKLYFFLLISFLLVACQEDPPSISLDGTWNIDIGIFANRCEVNAIVNENQVLIRFIDTFESSCQSESYGAREGILEMRIEKRTDSFDDAGAMMTRLNLVEDFWGMEFTVTLTQTAEGLDSEVESYTAERYVINPSIIVGHRSHLTRLPEPLD